MVGRRDLKANEVRPGEGADTAASSGAAPRSSHPLTRRSLLRSGFAALAAAPWVKPLAASSPSPHRTRRKTASQDEIVLGVSAAFSGPSRGLGTELYRGAMAYFSYVNDNGGVNGRPIVLKLYDDGYQPDACVANTLRLIQEDNVLLLFGYVGTPTVTRVLPLLKRFREQQVLPLLSLHGSGAAARTSVRRVRFQPAGLLPAGDGGAGRQFRRHRTPASGGFLPDRRVWAQRLGRGAGGAGTARRDDRGRGHVQPRYAVRSEHAAPGGNPEGTRPTP